jgi:hypothetical protein
MKGVFGLERSHCDLGLNKVQYTYKDNVIIANLIINRYQNHK